MSKKVTPRVDGGADQLDCLVAIHGRAEGRAHAHAAQANGRDFQVRLRPSFLFSIFGSPLLVRHGGKPLGHCAFGLRGFLAEHCQAVENACIRRDFRDVFAGTTETTDDIGDERGHRPAREVVARQEAPHRWRRLFGLRLAVVPAA